MTKTKPSVHNGVAVLTGYGLRLAVERGHLVVEDGIAEHRRRERFSRIDRALKRIVIIGHSGSITLDAIDWLRGVGVPLIHLDHDGQIYFVSSPSARGVAQLRRAQATVVDTPLGLAISRDLVVAKLDGQLTVLQQLPGGERVQDKLLGLREQAARARSLPKLRDCEARVARTYWRAWRAVPVRLKKADAKRRPVHWQSFGSRISPLTDPSPRKAVNPANAILNYLYAILEAEAIIAAQAARLDPMLGLLHTDRSERASLAHDLIEPVRPVVDAFALTLFEDRGITNDDVFELANGHCRLLPPLARQLAATAPLWERRVRPVADAVAKSLASPKRFSGLRLDVTAKRTTSGRRPRGRTAVVRGFDPLIADTWAAFAEPHHEWKGMPALQRHLSANREWDRINAKRDPEEFRRDILPALRDIPIQRLVDATGLSKTVCSQVRRGLKVPHARHWEGLRNLNAVA